MKRADIKVGDELAYRERTYLPTKKVRVVATEGFHLKSRADRSYYYGRSQEVPEMPLPDGSTLSTSSVVPADGHRPSNCIIIRPVNRDGSLEKPEAVRSATLVGPYAEIREAEVAASKAATDARRREADRKARNLAIGKDLMGRLEALGVKPSRHNGDYLLSAGKVDLTLNELAALLAFIPEKG